MAEPNEDGVGQAVNLTPPETDTVEIIINKRNLTVSGLVKSAATEFVSMTTFRGGVLNITDDQISIKAQLKDFKDLLEGM
jgi:hypothetical protein